jgi:hypothetical protein
MKVHMKEDHEEKIYLRNIIKMNFKKNYAIKYYLDCTATDESPSAGRL